WSAVHSVASSTNTAPGEMAVGTACPVNGTFRRNTFTLPIRLQPFSSLQTSKDNPGTSDARTRSMGHVLNAVVEIAYHSPSVTSNSESSPRANTPTDSPTRIDTRSPALSQDQSRVVSGSGPSPRDAIHRTGLPVFANVAISASAE